MLKEIVGFSKQLIKVKIFELVYDKTKMETAERVKSEDKFTKDFNNAFYAYIGG